MIYNISKQFICFIQPLCKLENKLIVNQKIIKYDSLKQQKTLSMSTVTFQDQITTITAIQNIIAFSKDHDHLIDKYSENFFLNYFDLGTLEDLQESVPTDLELTKKQFVKILTKFIEHTPSETLFLVISLLNIYKNIRQVEKGVKITDFTNYICEKISNKNEEALIISKQIAVEKIKPDGKRVRNIDLHPPVVISEVQTQIPKISKLYKKKNKKIDSNKPLSIFLYNKQQKQLMTLGRLSSEISIYNLELKMKHKIVPLCFQQFQKRIAILDMAFSERQQRIGCIINNVGLAFWDYSDNFQSEKIIKKYFGDKIYYLNLLDEWITTTSKCIYFWNLKEEVITDKISQPHSKSINDIQEITHLRALAVSYTFQDDHKYIIIYKNQKYQQMYKLKLPSIGSQQIHYNKYTQCLMLLGHQYLPLYSIDSGAYDLNFILNLHGHDSIITSVTDVEKSLVLTSDDHGNVRMWDLKMQRCQQIIKIANFINKIMCIDHVVVFSDARMNVLALEDLTQKVQLSEIFGFKHFYRFQPPNTYELYIFTRNHCRIFDMFNGRPTKIIEMRVDQEITAVEQLNQHFIVGTIKGNLICYSYELKKKWKMKAHELEVNHIFGDGQNKLFMSVGKEGNIFVWNEKTLLEEGPRKSIQNNSEKETLFEVNLLELSEKYSIFLTAENKPQLRIWDYQSCKLCHIIHLESNPTAIQISNSYPILAVATINQFVYFYQIQRRENRILLIALATVNLRYPSNSLNQIISNSLISLKQFQNSMNNKEQEKLELQFKSLYCQSIAFQHVNHKSYLVILSYGKGNIICYDIYQLINSFYTNLPSTKQNMNIQRPIKESLYKQFHKNQYDHTTTPFLSSEEGSNQNALTLSLNANKDKLQKLWNKKIHKDLINDMKIYEEKYISTLCIDGYFKLTTLNDGEQICSINIGYPLPIQWNYEPNRNQQLCKNIHHALSLISDILNDQSIEVTPEDISLFNVEQFLNQAIYYQKNHHNSKTCLQKNKHANHVIYTQASSLSALAKESILPKQSSTSTYLMKDQYEPTDLRRVKKCQSQISIKYLQAYKRVNLMKKIQKTVEVNYQYQQKLISGAEEKQSFLALLSPNYCPRMSNLKKPEEKEYPKHSRHASLNNSLHHSSLQQTLRTIKVIRGLSKAQSTIKIKKESNQTDWKKIQLKKNQPLKDLSHFIKDLNSKIPKQSQLKKNIAKKHIE